MPLYKLMPKLFTCNFNPEMILSITTQDQYSFSVEGEFKTFKDYGALIWTSEDKFSHSYCKYPTDYNFRDIILEYDYEIEGDLAELGDNSVGQSLIVETKSQNLDTTVSYIVNLRNYDTTRPVSIWETEPTQEEEITDLPQFLTSKRYFGEGNGRRGHILIDFDNLYAGWSPYTKWDKISPEQIVSIKWSFAPKQVMSFGKSPPAEIIHLEKNRWFRMNFNNWIVSGNSFLRENPMPLPLHSIRICDDYDDMYFMTPEWIIEQFKILGFHKIINFYIGASHYYCTTIIEEKTILDDRFVFNETFKAWFINYLKHAKQQNFNEIIASISMENLDAKNEWAQKYFNGVIGHSGWEPPPKFLSFCNQEVIEFYKRYVSEIATIQLETGFSISIQLGEPWWWSGNGWKNKGINNLEKNSILPCIYDLATQEKFKNKFGHPIPPLENIPLVETMPDTLMTKEEISWFADQIGEFMQSLIEHLTIQQGGRDKFKFGILFFLPTVIGPEIPDEVSLDMVSDLKPVPEMLRKINFPLNHWKYQNDTGSLDFFQIEDYDYLIDGTQYLFDSTKNEPVYIHNKQSNLNRYLFFNKEHQKSYNFAKNKLDYPTEKTHYFAGFVQYHNENQNVENYKKNKLLWSGINQAIKDGLTKGHETFLWAATQVFKGDWLPDDALLKTPTPFTL